jgi:hypothetical protein
LPVTLMSFDGALILEFYATPLANSVWNKKTSADCCLFVGLFGYHISYYQQIMRFAPPVTPFERCGDMSSSFYQKQFRQIASRSRGQSVPSNRPQRLSSVLCKSMSQRKTWCIN